jgi:hypothetical protein
MPSDLPVLSHQKTEETSNIIANNTYLCEAGDLTGSLFYTNHSDLNISTYGQSLVPPPNTNIYKLLDALATNLKS